MTLQLVLATSTTSITTTTTTTTITTTTSTNAQWHTQMRYAMYFWLICMHCVVLLQFHLKCNNNVHRREATIAARQFIYQVSLWNCSCASLSSSPKAISEEMSPIDYPESAVGPDLDIISLFTLPSAATPLSSFKVQAMMYNCGGFLGHRCRELYRRDG